MAPTRRREELASFLRARRAALSPEAARLPAGNRRRTPGLRREEVAQLADVGVTWYTWLEQGRDIRMSRETLERIACALRLSPTDRAYLFDLVDLAKRPLTREVDPPVQAVLDALEFPAMVINARFDVLAFNPLMDEIYRFDAYQGRFARNLIWRNFMDPTRRKLYANWENDWPRAVRILRAQYASRVEDASFEELIANLCESSPEFRRAWRSHSTEELSLVDTIRLDAPRLGALTLQSTRFLLADRPGDVLFVMVPADAQTRAALAKEGRRLTVTRRTMPRSTVVENVAAAAIEPDHQQAPLSSRSGDPRGRAG
jgi:transcriptional regulator with XRE-family HTH domain